VKLLEHAEKLTERAIDRQVRKKVEVNSM